MPSEEPIYPYKPLIEKMESELESLCESSIREQKTLKKMIEALQGENVASGDFERPSWLTELIETLRALSEESADEYVKMRRTLGCIRDLTELRLTPATQSSSVSSEPQNVVSSGGSSLSLEKKDNSRPVVSSVDNSAHSGSVTSSPTTENLLPGDVKYVSIAGVDTRFCWCPPGRFMMGSPESERGRDFTESLHEVTIPHGFWLAETPTTQQLWRAVTGENPSTFQGAHIPVHEVSWDDCQAFIGKIQQYSPVGMRFKLPSEAHWEYACRAGTNTPFSFGTVCNDKYCNCNPRSSYGAGLGRRLLWELSRGQANRELQSVRSYSSNLWGICDMHGSVFEWCEDWFGDYPLGTSIDPLCATPKFGSYRVVRGGSWLSWPGDCRSARREKGKPDFHGDAVGFRLELAESNCSR